MKKLFAIVVLLFSPVAFGQNAIVNQITEQHKPVLGSKISMVPPAGFVDAANFLGFQQLESGSTIMVVGMSGVPFSKISSGMTKEYLAPQGIELEKTENFTINNLPAVFVTAKQNVLGEIYNKYILCLGTEVETIVINAVYPKNAMSLGKELRTALLSTVYDAAKKTDELEVIDFDLDISKSELVFAKTMSNQMVLTKDGKAPSQTEDKTLLIAGKSMWNGEMKDKKQFCIDRLEELPISLSSEDSVSEITIDGLNGYEIYATTKNKITGAVEKVYQVMLFNDSRYFTFFGTTNRDFEKNLADIKQVILSFKRR